MAKKKTTPADKFRSSFRRQSRWRQLTALIAVLAIAAIGTYFLTASQAATTAPAGISPGGVFENTFRTYPTSVQNTIFANMKAAGVQWVRADVFPTNEQYQNAQLFANAGFKVMAVLQDYKNSPLTTPAEMAAFAQTAVTTLKPLGIHTYEVWNEPNGCEDSIPAAQYAKILEAVYPAIHNLDSSATVIMGGLCPAGGTNEPYNYLTAVYTQLKADGVKNAFDAVGDHPYTYPNTPLQNTQSWNPWTYLPQIHNIMASNGDNAKKIWLTEFGCPTGNRNYLCAQTGVPTTSAPTLANQISAEGSQITDAFCLMRSGTNTSSCSDAYCLKQRKPAAKCRTLNTSINYSSFVGGPLFVFNWLDSGDGNFGLYNSSQAPKTAALNAYKQAAAQ